jgi:hypothetical protein
MNNYDASDMDCQYVQCAVCDKAISGGKWFARISHGDFMVALCCPLCVEFFETNPLPYTRRIETQKLLHSADSILKQEVPA